MQRRDSESEGDAFHMQIRNKMCDLQHSFKKSRQIYGGCGANFVLMP